MTRVTSDDWADGAAVSAAPRRPRDWRRPVRQLPWQDEKRASAPFWRLRPASRPRRGAVPSHGYVLPSWQQHGPLGVVFLTRVKWPPGSGRFAPAGRASEKLLQGPTNIWCVAARYAPR